MKHEMRGGDPLDPLFRRAAADGRAGLPNDCVDADVLAAWADGILGREERTVVETHAAGCARCRAMLAAMVRTQPAEPAGAAPSWWRVPLRWAVPLATAAAALTIWVVVERTPAPADSTATVALQKEEAQAVTPPATAPAAPSVPLAIPEGAARKEARGATPGIDRVTPSAKSPAAEARVEPPTRTVTAEPGTLQSARRVAPPPAAAAAPPPPAAAAAAPDRRAGFSDTARVRDQAALATAAAPEVVSPDGSSRWRIGSAPGVVERSTDGGRTWDAQQTGATAVLVAGSSPAAGTCWLVGAAGTVVRSTDGRTWQRLAVPVDVDLVGVAAVDAETATVTAADGRRYRTTDGAVTWTPVR